MAISKTLTNAGHSRTGPGGHRESLRKGPNYSRVETISSKCHCGTLRPAQKDFCTACWNRLPVRIQEEFRTLKNNHYLGQRNISSHSGIYSRALAWLKENRP